MHFLTNATPCMSWAFRMLVSLRQFSHKMTFTKFQRVISIYGKGFCVFEFFVLPYSPSWTHVHRLVFNALWRHEQCVVFSCPVHENVSLLAGIELFMFFSASNWFSKVLEFLFITIIVIWVSKRIFRFRLFRKVNRIGELPLNSLFFIL